MRVAGYVRLSRDEDKESYSSILSQRSIIEEYAMEHNWTIMKYYEDDNCSGYSFDRPAFNELITDLESNRIDIIIAKDLSRIGRHNAYTLLFLDKVRKLNKRLILPKEGSGYDTEEDENDLLGITTWYNEMYVKDISRKIKSSIRAKQKEGRMIIRETFGYIRSQADKHKLEIDPVPAETVQKIFKLYLSGLGYRKISEQLNNEGYFTPSQHNNCKSAAALQWNSVHVQRILKNDIYIGTLRLGKTEKKAIKGKSQKKPLEGQFIFEDNHPAIISKETFEEVQLEMLARKHNHSKGAASLQNIFSGLIYCQDCGSYMIANKKQDRSKKYICGRYHMHGNKACRLHSIKEKLIAEAMKQLLKALLKAHSEEIGKIQLRDASKKYEADKQLEKKLIKELKQSRQHLKFLIMQKVNEMKHDQYNKYQSIINDSYKELENEIKDKMIYLEQKIEALKHKPVPQKCLENPGPIQILEQIIFDPQLEKKHMGALIDKILVDSRGNPTIYMKASIQALCCHSREDVNWVRDP